MSIRLALIAAMVSASFVGTAYARDAVATVKLEAPVSESTRVIAINTLWNCDGDTCLARPSHAVSVRACRQFVREAGGNVRVSSYGTERRSLSAEELARCNGDQETLQARN